MRMPLKTIVVFGGLILGILGGVTALLWNFSGQTAEKVEGVAGEMRHVRGKGEIVVTEWSDFQCPACAGAQAGLKEILERYQGKVKLVYRYLPLPSIHTHAIEAAEAAEAAGEQGKFWEMHDLLFAHQREWEGLEDIEGKLGEYAHELGLDEDKFLSDLTSEKVKRAVEKDRSEALRYRLQATPSFFVNGVKVELLSLEAEIQKNLDE